MQWEKIDEWMRKRHFDVFAPGVIVHPTLGKYLGPLIHWTGRVDSASVNLSYWLTHAPGEAYPDGKGSDIGVELDVLMSEQEDQHKFLG